LGFNPENFPLTKTLLPCQVKVISPFVLDPDLESKVALAFWPVPCSIDWQATRVKSPATDKPIATFFNVVFIPVSMGFKVFRVGYERLISHLKESVTQILGICLALMKA
jgi:hypothetical protein